MKILLVEDDTTLNQNIKDYLIQEHFDVETVFDGQMAEKLMQRNSYDCIILDINLPHKNGYELCKDYRTYNKDTPVLMLTAFDELEDKVNGYDSGADDYLTKPFYMKELAMRIKALIKRNNQSESPAHAETITIEDISINQKHKTVKRAGQEITLTPREYQILLKLALAKGQLVDKQELVKEIWGSSFDANTNTIEVFINFLRKKIDKPFEKQIIKTKVGYGYYLDI